MRNETALELRRLRQALDRAERRIATARLSGKVSDVDPSKRLLRLKLGTDAEGKDILSPWMRWQEAAAGGMKIHSEPKVGEQMDMVSASGTIGAASMAMPATYDQDNAAPSTSSTSAVFTRGNGRIELGDDGIILIGPVKMSGGPVTHNDVDIGDTHKHTDVLPGPALTGPPQP